MAYVLGYFTADGYMFINSGGSYYIAFVSTDYDLISKVREMLYSRQKISSRKYKNRKGKIIYRLQIGSKKLFRDLLDFGLIPNKSKKIKLPKIPKSYFRHFVRGYFDGDGCVDFGFYRKRGKKKATLMTKFYSSNKTFLQDLWQILKRYAQVKGGSLYKRERKFDLSLSVRDSFRLYNFMYKGVKKNQFLERKYNEFQQAINYYAGVA